MFKLPSELLKPDWWFRTLLQKYLTMCFSQPERKRTSEQAVSYVRYSDFCMKQFITEKKLSKSCKEQKDRPYLCNRQTVSSHNGGEGNFRWARCGLNVWQVPGHSRVCRPGLACSDLPGKEGEELRRVVMVLSPGQRLFFPSWRTCNSWSSRWWSI